MKVSLLTAPERGEPARPVEDAQRMELISRFASLQRRPKLEAGMIVRYKDGCGVPNSPKQRSYVLLRHLNKHDAQDVAVIREWIKDTATSVHALGVDVVLGAVGPESDGLLLRLAALVVLEPC